MIAGSAATALQIEDQLPVSLQKPPHAQQLWQIDNRRARVFDNFVKPWCAARQSCESRRRQQRDMRIRPAGAQPGKGIKPLHQIAKGTMLDHQNTRLFHSGPFFIFHNLKVLQACKACCLVKAVA